MEPGTDLRNISLLFFLYNFSLFQYVMNEGKLLSFFPYSLFISEAVNYWLSYFDSYLDLSVTYNNIEIGSLDHYMIDT